ncbi:hypothetical protein BDZ89DRAFT_1140547 [Hymenopellis radicata]|nr:hypothetical protein BDZ89DRAFT_1140547 [Hymenopellis radicata]
MASPPDAPTPVADILNPVHEVLKNSDLLTIICDFLKADVNRSGLPAGVTGQKIHPVLAIAMTARELKVAALDSLWKELNGLKPLLYLFPQTLTSRNFRTLPKEISSSMWEGFDIYTRRVQSLSCDPASRGSYSPRIYTRLAEHRKTIFPNLRRLKIDMLFAADPTIFFMIYSSPRLCEVEIVFDANPEADDAFGSVRAAMTELPLVDTLRVTCGTGDTQGPLFSSFCPAIALEPAKERLRTLSITSHPVDPDFFLQLSSFNILESLAVRVAESVPRLRNVDPESGFPVLTSLDIAANVTMMCRILHVLSAGVLKKLHFKDTANLAYEARSAAMLDLHSQLGGHFSLTELHIRYMKQSAARFSNFNEIQHLSYHGELAVAEGSAIFPSEHWAHLRSLHVVSAETISYKVLPDFARCCPELVDLKLPLLFPDQGVLEDYPAMNHHLHTLVVHRLQVTRHAKVAGFLNGIFPFLSDIKGGSGWKEVKEILIDACQHARRKERAMLCGN